MRDLRNNMKLGNLCIKRRLGDNMKTAGLIAILFSTVWLLGFPGLSSAEERLNGVVKSIDLNANTVDVVSYEGAEVKLSIEDEVTLAKLRQKRIRIDDDVKVKYNKVGDKNISTFFQRLLGCIP